MCVYAKHPEHQIIGLQHFSAKKHGKLQIVQPTRPGASRKGHHEELQKCKKKTRNISCCS